ncbi:MAG: hypothetical protein Q9207_000451 [Kuettlingeria erythrocarpa]
MAHSKVSDYLLLKPDEQLDLQHQVWALTLHDRLYLSPINKATMSSVLDIGCGSGAWVLAMAMENPEAHIVAADLTPPSISMPPNVTVEKWDAEKDWNFQHTFSFIHGRVLIAAIRDWPAILRRSWENLEPLGWLELQEVSVEYCAELMEANDSLSSPWIKWGSVAAKGFTASGIEWDMTSKHVQRLQEFGFENVREERFRWPLGEWAETERERQIGALTLQNFLRYLDTAGVKIVMQDPSVDEQVARKLKDDAYRDLLDNSVAHRYYLTVYVALLLLTVHIAQKPADRQI